MAFPYEIIKSSVEKNLSRIYTFWRGLSAILTIYNQIFFSRGPSALIFRDLSFLICFNGICQKKSAFLLKIWSDFSYDHFFHEKLYFFPKSSKWPGNQKFPSKSTLPDSKKILPEAKTLIFDFFFAIFQKFSKKSLK